MKTTKLFFVAICLLLLAPIKGWCDITVTPSNGITITITDSSYVIDYVGMDYMEQLDTLYSGEVFSKIVFPTDYFGLYHELDSIGRPILPFRPLELQLPSDAENVRVTCAVLDRSNDCQQGFHLTKPYFPYQDGFEGTRIVVQYDSAYYNTDGRGWYDQWYDISETYNIYGTTGIHFSIVPVQYIPRRRVINAFFESTIRVASHIVYTIKFDGSSLLDMMQEYLHGSHSEDALLFYDTYEGLGFEQTAMYKGRYAILTGSEFVDALQPFVDYKTHMGYDVEVYADDYASLGASGTRSFLKGLYDDQRTRPRFVLLVGNDTKIPMSAGVWQDSINPPTDIYYACLTHYDIEREDKFLTPSVHLGRWPAYLEQDVVNIINKTIITELGLGDESITNLSVNAFSGIGNIDTLTNIPDPKEGKNFYESLLDIETQIFHQLPVAPSLINGRVMPNPTNVISQRLQANTWMFIYRGHGWFTQLGQPYSFGNGQIMNLEQSEVSYFPFSFAFTCNTGGHERNSSYYNSYSRFLLNKSFTGAVSHFGSSVVSFTKQNNKLAFSIFSQLLDQKNKTITSITIDGTSKYYLEHRFSKQRQIQAKKYIYFGDPSIYIYGLNRFTGNPRNNAQIIETHEKATIYPTVTSKNIQIISSKDLQVTSSTIYNTSGVIVLESTTSEFVDISLLPNGIYFIVLKSKDNQFQVEKFIVQH